ncbi:MAG: hypothetical protein IJ275_07050 [Ruminococcus sp.]|nr:hypothetical protein [Ruminococcus sp.]
MKKIISFILIVVMLASTLSLTAIASSQYASGKYVDEFVAYLDECGVGTGEDEYMYEELYEYYSSSNKTDTPNWVLVRGGTTTPAPGTASGIFGNYYIFEEWYQYPYPLGYFIYIPEKENFYTLEFAWMHSVSGITKAFSEYLVKEGIAQVIEDVDSDGKITTEDTKNLVVGINHYDSHRKRPFIYFDANTVGWDNYEKVYCGITKSNGQVLYNPMSRLSLCTDFYSNGIWEYDLYNLSYIIENDSPLSINFHNENGEFTAQLTMDKSNIGDCVFALSKNTDEKPEIEWTENKSVADALAMYESETGEKVETNRYYFLMPDGTNGQICNDRESDRYGQFVPSWHNEYTNQPAIYWWDTGKYDPPVYPGYNVEKGDAEGVFYADVPKAVKQVIFSNDITVSFDTSYDPMYDYVRDTHPITTNYYAPGESPYYPSGTESFDNMICVVEPTTISINDYTKKQSYYSEWFYYYGDGCYGTVKNGTISDCIRSDHNHSISYTEKFKDYLLSTGYTEEQLQEGFWSSSPLYIYDDPYLDNPNFYLALVKGGLNDYLDASVYGVFGDYFLQSGELKPYKLGYYVYVSLEDKFYTLSEAWDLKINGIEEIFSEYFVKEGHAYVIGDQDQDGELSILDATAIQLTLVSTKDFSSSEIKYSTCVYGDELKNLCDADHDGDVSILDATQIQLKLAGLK